MLRSHERAQELPGKIWQVSTAIRVFALALVVGQVARMEAVAASGIFLLSLGLLAATACFLEADPLFGGSRWTNAVEAILTGIVVTGAATSAGTAPAEPLAVYLAVPTLVAGVRHGLVSSVNTGLAVAITLVASGATGGRLEGLTIPGGDALPWAVTGLGLGILASWLSRNSRSVEELEAPYQAAHRLLTHLHAVRKDHTAALDLNAVAGDLIADVARLDGVSDAYVVLPASVQGPVRLPSNGTRPTQEEAGAAQRALATNLSVRLAGATAHPVRVGGELIACLLVRTPTRSPVDEQELKQRIAWHSLRLDTALLFEQIRTEAIARERDRLAREIHDGAAQDIASLGYLIDDLSDEVDGQARDAVGRLRAEVTRTVAELRLSIFGLRHHATDASSLAVAVSELARKAGALGGFRVHVVLDERPFALAGDSAAEILRIAQEAIANVRKHAGAKNLWVRLTYDPGALLLEVEDDGNGLARGRDGHYGIRNMQERADHVGADLRITGRPASGTKVTLELPAVRGRTPARKAG